ncbi:uncharacterized protein LOC119107252 [Pollicipes pollicipes]|uniref:uncharacterized protein LOC119107252 n=1 Tax=Pollicipes pollicipes TaxID=41117 RepID=UPI0018851787|nr:uncharacterized protein LOC119107252 [Pollicipes pollicipes]
MWRILASTVLVALAAGQLEVPGAYLPPACPEPKTIFNTETKVVTNTVTRVLTSVVTQQVLLTSTVTSVVPSTISVTNTASETKQVIESSVVSRAIQLTVTKTVSQPGPTITVTRTKVVSEVSVLNKEQLKTLEVTQTKVVSKQETATKKVTNTGTKNVEKLIYSTSTLVVPGKTVEQIKTSELVQTKVASSQLPAVTKIDTKVQYITVTLTETLPGKTITQIKTAVNTRAITITDTCDQDGSGHRAAGHHPDAAGIRHAHRGQHEGLYRCRHRYADGTRVRDANSDEDLHQAGGGHPDADRHQHSHGQGRGPRPLPDADDHLARARPGRDPHSDDDRVPDRCGGRHLHQDSAVEGRQGDHGYGVVQGLQLRHSGEPAADLDATDAGLHQDRDSAARAPSDERV